MIDVIVIGFVVLAASAILVCIAGFPKQSLWGPFKILFAASFASTGLTYMVTLAVDSGSAVIMTSLLCVLEGYILSGMDPAL